LTLVPYGRFCNATKFAGEVDVMEALAAVRAQYPIDPQRIAVAGFSMGGGSTWHLATHFPGLWCVASPGAGFAETPIFTKALAPGKEARAPWEQLLWRQYEGTGLAGNLAGLPTLAYAGEIDGQKEASDLMEAAATREGVKLERFIGPQTAHKYHPETKETLTRRLEELIARGRAAVPTEVRFATYTLRYAESAWVRIEGMGRHWERAEVRARLAGDGGVEVTTTNVTHLQVSPPGLTRVVIDGTKVVPAKVGAAVRLQRTEAGWRELSADDGLRKRPGLTGPVDDAFVEPFLFVRPTGKPLDADVGAWVESELTAARHLWHDVFRGEVPTKSDREVTEADIADRNLILWGDPSSNAVLARVLAKLPLQWDAKRLVVAGKTHTNGKVAPILVFPNPLNPRRYVVLNSGIDFRSEGYGNNALQTAKLPDWAVVDVRTPAGPRWPGKVLDAGFFNEQWR
jgi:dienelactone hydrolase